MNRIELEALVEEARHAFMTDTSYAISIARDASEALERRAHDEPRPYIQPPSFRFFTPREKEKIEASRNRILTEDQLARNRANALLGGRPPKVTKAMLLSVDGLSKEAQAKKLGVSRSAIQRARARYRDKIEE